jgi:hypothetical protein
MRSKKDLATINKRIIAESYGMAAVYMVVALAGVGLSIYALVVFKKTVLSYTAIVIAVLIVVIGIIWFFQIEDQESTLKFTELVPTTADTMITRYN